VCNGSSSQEYSACDYLYVFNVSWVTVCSCVRRYHQSGTRTGAHTNTTEAMWKHKVCFSAYNRRVHYIFHLAQQPHVWGYVPLAQSRPLPVVRGGHSGLCSHACTHPPPVTVRPNPSTASSTHHCHSGRVLPYPYPKLSCSGRSILRYSLFISTEIQLCHSMNINNHQIILTVDDSRI
jgi:hypothetical protein